MANVKHSVQIISGEQRPASDNPLTKITIDGRSIEIDVRVRPDQRAQLEKGLRALLDAGLTRSEMYALGDILSLM